MPAHFLQAQFCKIGDLGKTFGYTVRPVNDATEGSTQEAPMYAS